MNILCVSRGNCSCRSLRSLRCCFIYILVKNFECFIISIDQCGFIPREALDLEICKVVCTKVYMFSIILLIFEAGKNKVLVSFSLLTIK